MEALSKKLPNKIDSQDNAKQEVLEELNKYLQVRNEIAEEDSHEFAASGPVDLE